MCGVGWQSCPSLSWCDSKAFLGYDIWVWIYYGGGGGPGGLLVLVIVSISVITILSLFLSLTHSQAEQRDLARHVGSCRSSPPVRAYASRRSAPLATRARSSDSLYTGHSVHVSHALRKQHEPADFGSEPGFVILPKCPLRMCASIFLSLPCTALILSAGFFAASLPATAMA